MGLAPTPLYKLVKDLGVQTDNIFSPSAQCTGAANKARRLIFAPSTIIRNRISSNNYARVRLHLQYGMSACTSNLVAYINHLERIHGQATRLVTDFRHLDYEERLQRRGLCCLQRRRRLRANLITVFTIFTGLLDIDPNLFSFLPLDTA